MSEREREIVGDRFYSDLESNPIEVVEVMTKYRTEQEFTTSTLIRWFWTRFTLQHQPT